MTKKLCDICGKDAMEFEAAGRPCIGRDGASDRVIIEIGCHVVYDDGSRQDGDICHDCLGSILTEFAQHATHKVRSENVSMPEVT